MPVYGLGAGGCWEGGSAIAIAVPAGVAGADGYWRGGGAIETAVLVSVGVLQRYWEDGGAIEVAAPAGVVLFVGGMNRCAGNRSRCKRN